MVYNYDTNGNRIAEIKTRSVTTATGLVNESITNQSTFDLQNRVVATRVSSSLAGVLQNSSVLYNHLGQQAASIDTANHTTTNIYDFAGKLVETQYPDGTVSRTAYNADGLPEYVQDRVKKGGGDTVAPATRTTYDASGRSVRVDRFISVRLTIGQASTDLNYFGDPGQVKMTATSPAATDLLTTTRTFYDSLGRVQYSVDARTNVTQSVYDSAGRRVATKVYPAPAQISSWSDTTSLSIISNALNNVTPAQTTQFTYDPNGNQRTVTDSLGRTTTSVYDSANRLVETVYPEAGQGRRSHFTQYDGLGQRILETDENGVNTKYQYDFRGLLTAVTLAADTDQATTTIYQYDELGNLIKQTDAARHCTTFKYDALGRRIARTLPEGQTQSGAYDVSGNLIYQTNCNGVVITNAYDQNNRLTNQASVGGDHVVYKYSPTGQRTSMLNSGALVGFSYDSLNRLTNKTTVFGKPNGGVATISTLIYGYDRFGALTNISSSTIDTLNLAYGYDVFGRLTNVLFNGSPVAGYGFDKVGNLAYTRYGNGVTNLYQYDARNRLTNLVWKLNGGELGRFYYQLGPTGVRTSLIENVNGTARFYVWAYDSLYRLTGESITSGGSPLAAFGYGYDPVGNRTNLSSTFGSIPSVASSYTPNDWLSTDNYDANGNTTNSAGMTFRYDAMNHLTNMGSSMMGYDGDGYRVYERVGNTVTYYLLDDQNPSGNVQVLAQFTSQYSSYPSETYGTPVLDRTYAFGPSLICQSIAPTPPSVIPSISYYGMDGHGSVRFLTALNGSVTDTYTYDAYGNRIDSSGSTSNNHLYCGEQLRLGMYWLRNRNYLPASGRFWTMDTQEGGQQEPRSLHRYSYAENDPINRADPSGRSSLTEAELGKAVHKYISADFEKEVKGFAITGKSVATALNKFGIKIDTITALFPDLVDINPQHKEVYEIKPSGLTSFACGELQLQGYLQLFNALDPAKGWEAGFHYTPPLAFVVQGPLVPPTPVVTTGPIHGVILYSSISKYFARKARNTAIAENADLEDSVLGSTLTGFLGCVF